MDVPDDEVGNNGMGIDYTARLDVPNDDLSTVN